MDEIKVITMYCACDDLLKAEHHREDPQRRMSDAEVLTTAIVAARYFFGHQERACIIMRMMGYIPTMLSISRFNRRLHRLWPVLETLAMTRWSANRDSEAIYIIDSFPIPVCENSRIKRCHLYRGTRYRGYRASTNTWFYGLKIQLMTTADGRPVEVFFTPGGIPDNSAIRQFNFDLPPGSSVYADAGYTYYALEGDLQENCDISFRPARAKNSRGPWPGWMVYLQQHYRRYIETVGSMINVMFPKRIHAVTAEGFELKLLLFIVAYTFEVT